MKKYKKEKYDKVTISLCTVLMFLSLVFWLLWILTYGTRDEFAIIALILFILTWITIIVTQLIVPIILRICKKSNDSNTNKFEWEK